MALILKAKFKKLFFEEISLKNLRKKDFQFGLNIKSQFFKLKKNLTVFKHFQFGLNIKSQFFKLKKYWTVIKHFQFGPNIKSQF